MKEFENAHAAEDEDAEALVGFGKPEGGQAEEAAEEEENFGGDEGLLDLGEVADGPEDVEEEPRGIRAGDEDDDAFALDEAEHGGGDGEGDDGKEVGEELPFEQPEAVEEKPKKDAENFEGRIGFDLCVR